MCDVRDFGAKGDGRTLDTRAIQAAVDSCAGRGGTVYLGQGTYVSGSVSLKSHMTLKLGRGAVLSGSHNIKDYWPSSRIGLGHTYGADIAGEGQVTGRAIGGAKRSRSISPRSVASALARAGYGTSSSATSRQTPKPAFR
ncbi:MAG: glycosyl hydrolase family 28-related protein [Sphingomicrobium sp.]